MEKQLVYRECDNCGNKHTFDAQSPPKLDRTEVACWVGVVKVDEEMKPTIKHYCRESCALVGLRQLEEATKNAKRFWVPDTSANEKIDEIAADLDIPNNGANLEKLVTA